MMRVLAVALAMTFSAVVSAAAKDESIDDTFYLGFGAGISFLEPESDSVALTLDEDSDTGYKLFGGYRFNSRLGMELFWADLGAAELGSASGGSSDVDYSAFGIGAVYTYPLNARWSLLGKAGVGRLDNEADAIDLDVVNENFVYLGAGASWEMAAGWDLRAEYEYFDSDTQFLSVNLVRRFGGDDARRVDELERQIEAQERQLAELAEKVAAASVVTAPASLPPEVDIACIDGPIELRGVDFAYRSVELSDASRRVLDEVIARIAELPDDVRIEIRAHTDNIGTETYNYVLSLSRARNVRDYMVGQGIALERIDAHGYGELHPLVSNETEEGRRRNRRAELVLLGIDRYIDQAGDCAGVNDQPAQ